MQSEKGIWVIFSSRKFILNVFSFTRCIIMNFDTVKLQKQINNYNKMVAANVAQYTKYIGIFELVTIRLFY